MTYSVYAFYRDQWVKKIAQAHIDYQQTKKKQEREKELKSV